jgi:predicted dienelactone hydrolase
MKFKQFLAHSMKLGLCLGLAACGQLPGNAKSATNGTSSATPAPSPTPAPAPAPTPSPAPTGAPTIASVSPNNGLNDSSTNITIMGSGFTGASDLVLNSSPQTTLSFVVVNDQRVTAIVPTGVSPGSFDLVIDGAPGPSWTVRNMLDPEQAGAFQVGFLDTIIPGASGDSPSARIHYPALSSGLSASPDPLAGPYPVVVYNHGFKPPILNAGIDYKNNNFVTERLASFGYIVICVDLATNNVLFGNNASAQSNSQRDADDARAALDYLQVSNTDPQHLLSALIDFTKAAIAGHSRGGCASILAASDELAALGSSARIKTIAVFGPPSDGITTGSFQSIPSLFIGASQDQIAPYANQVLLYGMAGAGSMIFEIIGGNHSQYKDSSAILASDGSATLSLGEQQAICQRTLVSWFNTHIKGTSSAFADYIYNGKVLSNDSRIRGIMTK